MTNDKNVERVAREPNGVQGLVFRVYVYGDHSVVQIARHDYLPLRGRDLRLGHFGIPVGRQHLRGLSAVSAVRAVCAGVLLAVSDQTITLARPQGIGAPLGATGGTVTQDPLPGL